MDLRPYIKSRPDLDAGIDLIRKNLLFYQPFILSDDIEVGEGQNLRNGYKGVESVFDFNVYARDEDVGSRKQPENLEIFRKYNQEYRQTYDYVCDQICSNVSADLGDLSIAEIGCNTGLNLFNLSVRGAKQCYGYDWNDMSSVFAWLNRLLGTNVKFTHGTYCNLTHRFKNADVPVVDIMINTIFLNHQCDPLQFLSYICDRASRAVFLWVLMEDPGPRAGCFIRYPDESFNNIIKSDVSFPLCFNNGISISEPLLRLSLRKLGFEDFRPIDKYVPSPDWMNFQSGFRMFFALRTKDVRSAYWSLGFRRRLVSLAEKVSTACSRSQMSG